MFEPDKHYEKVFRLHCKTRTHSYVNIGWMLITGFATIYFGYYLFYVETDVKCIAVGIDPLNKEFIRFNTMKEVLAYEQPIFSIQDVSRQFDFTIGIIFYQALVLHLISICNFLSHFWFPKILMYAKQIKGFNTINLVFVGVVCLVVLIHYRMNESANFCTGSHLKEADENYLIMRGSFLWKYTAIVITLSLSFIAAISTFCVCNLKKMGF